MKNLIKLKCNLFPYALFAVVLLFIQSSYADCSSIFKLVDQKEGSKLTLTVATQKSGNMITQSGEDWKATGPIGSRATINISRPGGSIFPFTIKCQPEDNKYMEVTPGSRSRDIYFTTVGDTVTFTAVKPH
jgi:hypothetical protein